MQVFRVAGFVTLMFCVVLTKNNNNNKDNDNGGVLISGAELDYSLKKRITQSLNYHRANVEPTSADMRYVSWSNVLETMATYTASQCQERVEGGRECSGAFGAVQGFAPYVTNPDESTYEQLVEGWFDSTYYMYECNQCYADEPNMCEQYTQVTHSNVTSVGCASSLCYMEDNDDNDNNNNNNNNDDDDNMQIGTTLVCFFTPGYLFEDQDDKNNDNNNNNNNNNNDNNNNYAISYPYKQGQSCSKCQSESPFCKDRLCATWYDVFGASHTVTSNIFLIASFMLILLSIL